MCFDKRQNAQSLLHEKHKADIESISTEVFHLEKAAAVSFCYLLDINLPHLESSPIQFWSVFIPVNGGGRIHPTLTALSPTPTLQLA